VAVLEGLVQDSVATLASPPHRCCHYCKQRSWTCIAEELKTFWF